MPRTTVEKNSKKNIIKVQRSLFTSDSQKKVLIYDEHKEIFYEVEDLDEIEEIEALLKEKEKAYFNYTIDKERKLIIGEEVPAQEW